VSSGTLVVDLTEAAFIGYNRAQGVHEMNIATNLQEVRVTLRWPLFQQGTNWIAGSNKRTFRAIKNGRVSETVDFNQSTFYVNPNNYSYIPYVPGN
jgi:hypothetical protein